MMGHQLKWKQQDASNRWWQHGEMKWQQDSNDEVCCSGGMTVKVL